MRNGKPASLAADIIDADHGWNVPRSFWLILGSSALAHGLSWGGLWGLSAKLKNGTLSSINANDWDANVKLGWDLAHVETSTVSIQDAKSGLF
jgi:hypothetical protein